MRGREGSSPSAKNRELLYFRCLYFFDKFQTIILYNKLIQLNDNLTIYTFFYSHNNKLLIA